MQKLRSYYYKARSHVVARLVYLWIQTPWFKAILRTALATYGDSDSYKIRCTELDAKFAFHAFFEYGELSHWKWAAKRDGRMNWWRIIFTPYSIYQEEVSRMFVLGF